MQQGAKKPLNLLENPVPPCITKGPSPFARWSGVNFKAAPEDILLQSRCNPNFSEALVLNESRDANQTRYGQSSYRSYVNKEFRPPIIPWECQHPWSRMPRRETTVRVNPTAADNESGRLFVAQNNNPLNIDKEVSEYKTPGDLVAPTYYHPIDMPVDNSVLPDLEMKLPQVCVTAGVNAPITIDAPTLAPQLEYEKKTVPIQTGYTIPISVNGYNAAENLKLQHHNPQVFVEAGTSLPIYTQPDLSSAALSRPLENCRPQVSVSAGITTPFLYDARQGESVINLEYNGPQVSASAGAAMPYYGTLARPDTDPQLHLSRPQVSVSAGATPTFMVNGETNTDYLLNEKLAPSYTVVNAGPTDTGLVNNLDGQYQSIADNLVNNRPSYSYTVPAAMMVVDENERTVQNRRQVQEKRYANSLYHGGMCTASAIPRAGLTAPPVRLRDAKKAVGLR